MAIEIKIKVDTSILDRFKVLPARAKKQAFERVCDEFISATIENINKGVTVGGKAFAPYSDGYKSNKERAGRMGENFWFRLTGKMLASMTASASKDRGRVTFEGQRPGSKFTNPGVKRAITSARRKTRSGGVETTGIRSAYYERKKKKGMHGKDKLVVSTDASRTVSNSYIAWVNNQRRDRRFFGLNNKIRKRLVNAFKRAVRFLTYRDRK